MEDIRDQEALQWALALVLSGLALNSIRAILAASKVPFLIFLVRPVRSRFSPVRAATARRSMGKLPAANRISRSMGLSALVSQGQLFLVYGVFALLAMGGRLGTADYVFYTGLFLNLGSTRAPPRRDSGRRRF